jgi:hypothetical protein
VLACAEISPCAHRRLRIEPEAFVSALNATKRTIPGITSAIATAEPLFKKHASTHRGRARRRSQTRMIPRVHVDCGRMRCRDGLHIHAENLVVEMRDPDADTPSRFW